MGINQAYQCAYEPGSTFKVLTLAASLDAAAVTEGTTVTCSGGLAQPGKYVRCSHTHGTVGIDAAIAESCNVAAMTWASRLGRDKFISMVDKLKLTQAPSLGMSRASTGSFARNDPAQRLQLAVMSFGQGIVVNPVRLAAAFACIGNGGKFVEPQIIESVNGVPQIKPAGQRVFSVATSNRVMRAMVNTFEAEGGTATKLRIPGVQLAGKTGTAEKNQNGRVGEAGFVASFVGFVPAYQPKAIVLVMVDDPKGLRYHGAEVAGPVFTEIARAILHRSNITSAVPVPNEIEMEVSVRPSGKTNP
jgi:cell division protein FtsI/penicillin-binding protein 2